MSALDSYSPAQAAIVKIYAYPFHAAVTADLVAQGVAALNAGITPAQILNILFNLSVPQSPFTAYALTANDAAFTAALVENFSFGTSISTATKSAWTTELTPLVSAYASRGDFTVAVAVAVENYSGTNPDLVALRDALAARSESAAAFAQSAPGAVYDGQGWGQLTAPLDPPAPEPTYALSVSAATVDEGQSVSFTLQTTEVSAGTVIGYSLAGTGINAADLMGGLLAGNFTIGSDGSGSTSLTFANDTATEGRETLSLTLAGGLGQTTVDIRDTSLSPPPPAYVLSVNASSRNEGGSLIFMLTTANLPTGSVVPFTLSGTGITAADIAGGQLSGSFTTDVAGKANVTIGLAADALTEGSETLRMTLVGGLAQITSTIEDTSVTPEPGGPDVLAIADDMSNSQSRPPQSALEGEIGINTYLTYDLLRQTPSTASRMSLSDLRATSDTAGAPLNDNNRSADRGNIPQVSNQHQYTFDLGQGTDRADYSAESGQIVLVVSAAAPSNTLWVLVNDDAVDNTFDDATDRIDTLINVDEVVAANGGGVLDLTASGDNWLVRFSASTDVDDSRDRELRRIELDDLVSGTASGLALLDYRGAGLDDSVSALTAVWTDVQGSDRDETLDFTDAESLDERSNVLRGGTNSLLFDELTRSVLTQVSITPWAAISNAADDTNGSGVTVATTTFTNGNGVTLLSPASNVTSSHTPDNLIAAGLLKIRGSNDDEDALSFTASPLAMELTLGQRINGLDVVSVRLLSGPVDSALEASGFEKLKDNGGADDTYVVVDIVRATQSGPELVDSATADHDLVRIANTALGTAPVGGIASRVNLETLNGASAGFDFDFDVLDLSAITSTGLIVTGTAGSDDELVVGSLTTLATVTLFESLVLTEASLAQGSSLTLDLDAGAIKSGSAKLFNYDGAVLSGNGLVFGTAGQVSAVAALTSELTLTVIDTSAGPGATVWGGGGVDVITGGAGDDTLRGGGGNDTLDGGISAESWQFQLSGSPDFATPANRIAITLTVDGEVLTLSEAAVADTSYADGDGAVVDGAGRSVIGAALAALVNANLSDINDGPGTGTLAGASWSSADSTLQLSFEPGVDADDVVTLVVAANGDSGTFAISSGQNLLGGSSGDDMFVFEASGALNGADSLLNFVAGSDKLDVTAFTGVNITGSRPDIDGAVGGNLTGQASKVELIYNKSGGLLSASDFTTGTVTEKFGMPDGTHCVVAVTADPTGAAGDSDNTPVRLYYVVNGPGIGLSDLSVTLVGVVSGPDELTLDEIADALG